MTQYRPLSHMKIILIGHPGSQKIKPITEYLNKKYLKDFDIFYLDYVGKIENWSKYLVDYLSKLSDENIIFALDDYLINAPVNKEQYGKAMMLMKDEEVVCIKLCENTEQEFKEYPVTTQYCLWDREFLISILEQTTTPWDFEIKGSKIFYNDAKKKVLLETCFYYYTNSSLSKRWEGVDLKGLSDEDRKEIAQWI